MPKSALVVARRQIKVLREQLQVERTTIGTQHAEIVALRQEMQELKITFEKKRAVDDKGWSSMYDRHKKAAETALQSETGMRKRLESLTVHATLALQACERGRKVSKKAKALGQARVMLEAGLAEEAKLAKEGVWATVPFVGMFTKRAAEVKA